MKKLTHWGAIQPAESLQTRLRLDFGLRPAILAFNEWAVPGLGGAFFVRQLSWGCMGIALASALGKPSMASKVAEGIEAYASWIALKRSKDYEKDDRIQGRRKFSELNAISFDNVSKGGAYVTIPFRRATTAALPGLGFCVRVESRFNALKLDGPGHALVDAALGNSAARGKLLRWLGEPSKPSLQIGSDLLQALLPGNATEEERTLVRTQLFSSPRRACLLALLSDDDASLSSLADGEGRHALLEQIRDPEHRSQLDACFAMERVREHALRAAQTLVEKIKDSARTPDALARIDPVQTQFTALATSCADMAEKLTKLVDVPPEIRAFCNEQAGNARMDARIRLLAARVPLVFSVVDGRIERGMGYTDSLVGADVNDAVDDKEASRNGSIPRPLLRLKRMHEETANAA